MRVVLDACVLVPTVMRTLLLGAGQAGLFAPRWSARIEEEWARAAARDGPAAEAHERGQIALWRTRIDRAVVPPDPDLERRLWLPDPGDLHVLACAIRGHADVIVTMNARDFPRAVLGEWSIARADPDGFLLGLYEAHPGVIADLAEATRADLSARSGSDWPLRQLMKKARLPRLGKAIERAGQG